MTVDVTAPDGDGASLPALATAGLTALADHGRLRARPADDSGLARLSGPISSAGLVNNEADHALHTDLARVNYGVSGAGVKVGILSDSFDTDATAATHMAQDIANGDLPASVSILEDWSGGGQADEGRALAQVIHDIAPGASIAFATAYGGQEHMAANILALANAGCKVIIDDVAYPDELYYQDGPIAQAIDQVAAMGVAYVSAAGNDGNANGVTGFEKSWVSGSTYAGDGYPSTLLTFAPGKDYLPVTIAGGELLVLQWTDPGSTAGGPGANADLDVYLTSQDGSSILASAAYDNLGGDPVEVLDLSGVPAGTYSVRVGLYAGPAPTQVKLMLLYGASTTSFGSSGTNLGDGTLYGHPAAQGAMAIGSIYYGDTTSPTAQPEPYSTAGYDRIVFADNGGYANPTGFRHVAFVAPDGGNSTFLGSDDDGDGKPNFYGSSAAAAAAAGLVALVVGARPELTLTDLRNLLTDAADDVGQAGFDEVSGSGQMSAAMGALFSPNAAISNTLAWPAASLQGTHLDDLMSTSVLQTLNGLGGNDTLMVVAGLPASVQARLNGGSGDDTLIGGAGDDTMDGGTGIDTASYQNALAATQVNLGLQGGPQDTGGAGTDVLSNIRNLTGSPFNDTLFGDGNDNLISGGSGNDTLIGAAGNDTLDGGGGMDTASYAFARGRVDVSLLHAGAQDTGIDGIETLMGIENLVGSAFADSLTGSSGANSLDGGLGNDTLLGGGGDDTLAGGGGNDIFSLAAGDGRDVIPDFTAGGTDDSIDLSAYAHVSSFEQVLARAVQSGPDTILKLGDEDQVTLSGVTKSALTSADFTLSAALSPDFGSGADFNGDGTGDVLWRDNTGLVALWRFVPGSGAVSYAGIDTVGPSWHIQGAADFDGDGSADVLWRNDSGFVALWQSTPSGRYSYVGLGQVGLNWHVQAMGDFNGDGKADVLWRDDNGLTAEWRSSPQGLVYVGIDHVGLNWHVQATADFNGDGLSDILWRDDTGFVAEWLSIPGASQASYVGLNPAGLDWTILGAGDFNGDGKADILWRQDTGLVGLWQSGGGSSALTYVGLANVSLDWHMQAMGDFNHDGKADVLWRNDSGQVAVWDSSPGGISFQDLGVVGGSWFIS